jgi:hypothetical protein
MESPTAKVLGEVGQQVSIESVLKSALFHQDVCKWWNWEEPGKEGCYQCSQAVRANIVVARLR